MKKISILIADDHKLVRHAWEFLFNRDDRFHVVGMCATAEEAIELTSLLQPDVVLMDINLPGMNGVEATREIRRRSSTSKIIGVSMYSEPAYARAIMKRGASGYVTKNSSTSELFLAVAEVFAGKKYVCNDIKNSLSDSLVGDKAQEISIDLLSEREIQIMSQIRSGASTRQIAEQLRLSVKTIEVHRFNILKKLNLKNVAALVNFITSHPELQLYR